MLKDSMLFEDVLPTKGVNIKGVEEDEVLCSCPLSCQFPALNCFQIFSLWSFVRCRNVSETKKYFSMRSIKMSLGSSISQSGLLQDLFSLIFCEMQKYFRNKNILLNKVDENVPWIANFLRWIASRCFLFEGYRNISETRQMYF